MFSPLTQSFDRGDSGDMGIITFIFRGKTSEVQRNEGSWPNFHGRRAALQGPGYLKATTAFEIAANRNGNSKLIAGESITGTKTTHPDSPRASASITLSSHGDGSCVKPSG